MRRSKRPTTRRPARTLALLVGLTVAGGSGTALAGSKGGAFAGGLIAGHVLTNMANRQERQTRAMEYQAYQGSAAAQRSSRSVEERLAQLDKLAAGGYITKQEYRRRRQAILDDI